MSHGSESEQSALESLSALADGELDSAAATRACAAWRDDRAARATWHAYHLIGDVLRSDDLALPASRDAAFVAALRTRLADEPIVLAPEVAVAEPVVAGRRANAGRSARWSWMAPSAVAAGFVLVAGALMVTRAPAPNGADSSESTLAQGASIGAPLQVVNAPSFSASDSTVAPQSLVVDGRLIRDARLERYLAAHKQFAGSSVLGVPSGFLRNAAADAPNR
ncbi:MAG: anti-sigma 24 factor [Betaproteobacteria bacterium]|nr:MAG: anti-sigma 24 factor [Betaproteobacteria bacterium]TMH32101.1 MAG: anti-sigma 24 factor [Betaproteobacteria bacterium]